MTDEELASYIYGILLEKELSLRDIHRDVKNQHPKENQVQGCLKLLLDQSLVKVIKKNGVDMWSLRSEADAQQSVETLITVNESGGSGTRRSSRQTSSGDRGSIGQASSKDRGSSRSVSSGDRGSSRPVSSGERGSIGQASSKDRCSSRPVSSEERGSIGQASSKDRGSSRHVSSGDRRSRGQTSSGERYSFGETHSNLSSTNDSFSYAEVAKSTSRLKDPTPPRGADSEWPLPSPVEETLPLQVSKNGDYATTGRRNEKAYSGDRSSTRSSHQSLRDSAAETERPRNRPKESMGSSAPSNTSNTNTTTTQPSGAGSLCPQPVQAAGDMALAVQDNTTNTVRKSFGRMELSTSGDNRVAEYTNLRPEAQECYNNVRGILQVLKNAEKPLKATEIAKKAGIGESKKHVNGALYFLEGKGMIKKSNDGCPLWTMIPKELTDEFVRESAIEHFIKKNPGVEPNLDNIPGSPDSRSTSHPKNCKTCKGPCINIEQTHIHNNHYYMQSGNTNIINIPQSDAISPVENR